MLDHQLAAALEEIGQRALAVGRVEDVLLVDAHPRQRAALLGELVAQMRQLFLARQQFSAL
jgi:regulator of RNase E activity RraA